MENYMFDMTESSISQDQSLVLQSQVLAYVREALVYDKGYVVFAVKDRSTFEFEIYHTDGNSIAAQYEETRDETIDRILFTIDCKVFCKLKKDAKALNVCMKYLYNYFLGALNYLDLQEKFGISDETDIFRNEYPDE